jgi:acetyl-CoA carboxylase biotin carboxyl carrier protein
MIDIRKLKELVRLMVENDLSELDLRDQEETVTLRRPGPAAAPVVQAVPVAAPAAAPAAAAAPQTPAEDDSLHAITSPMVGTFYSSPNPDTPAFASVGKPIGTDTTVCLVEAMKVFTEIKAECSGTIEKILVKNGDAVEFGQKLFLVRAD